MPLAVVFVGGFGGGCDSVSIVWQGIWFGGGWYETTLSGVAIVNKWG